MRRSIHIFLLACLLLTSSPSSAAQPGVQSPVYLPVLARNFTAPSVWDVPGLIAAMQSASANCAVPAVIVLAPAVFTFTVPYEGSNALPKVNCDLTIIGNNSTLARDPAGPDMRFIEVGSQGNLTLRSLNLAGGRLYSVGGALFNLGSLLLQDVTFTNNTANFGGALGNYGMADLFRVRFNYNQALIWGGAIEHGQVNAMLSAADLQFTGNRGGALHANGGTVKILDSCLAGNTPNYAFGSEEPQFTSIVQNDSITPVEFSSSWWGSASGPGGAAPGNGESVSNNVNFGLFRTSPPAGCPAAPAVTAILVSTPDAVVFDMGTFLFPSRPISLTAQLYGIGAFAPAVSWSVVSGGGGFADPAANPVVFIPAADPGKVTLRAASVSNPEVFSEYAAETAAIELVTIRKWATVLTGGLVPFNTFLKINGSWYARSGPVGLQIVSGAGSLTPPVDAYTSDFFYNAPQVTGSATIRAALKANPALYQDMQVTVNASGPHTCSNLRVTPTGPQTFSIGMNPPAGAPVFTTGTINEAGALIGDTQVVTVSAYVKEPAISPISVMTFTFNTDLGASAPVLGTLVSGDGFNGVWRASWVTDATQCENQSVSFYARNEVQVSVAGLGFR